MKFQMTLKQISCFVLMLMILDLGITAQTKKYSWDNLPTAELPTFKKDTFNIISYGAVVGGKKLNTKSINNAISDCSLKGGGVVLIPKGEWLTGPIVMKSNVNLHISDAAFLLFTSDKNEYKLIMGDYEGHPSPRNESPISGNDLVNIAITGNGTIDGHGEVWRPMSKGKQTESEWTSLIASGGVVSANGKTWYPSQSFASGATMKEEEIMKPSKSLKDYEDIKDFFRPNMVVLNNCQKVLLQNTTFKNSPGWCLHILLCKELTIQGIHVNNNWNAQNGDALDIESCKDVVLENSTFNAGDDGICVKSGRDEAGRKRGIPTENMVVRNCMVYRAHGGFVIGSEMSGGAKNIFVTNCIFNGTDIGLRFKTTRGRGGVVENIFIKNIKMKDIVREAVLFDMYYAVKSAKTGVYPVTDATPQFKEFYVNNIVCDGAAKGLLIRGLPEMSIKGIHFEDLELHSLKGAEIVEAEDISLKNVSLFSSSTNPVVFINNGTNIKVEGLKYSSNPELLFSVNGEKSAQIKVDKTDFTSVGKTVEFSNGASENSFIKK